VQGGHDGHAQFGYESEDVIARHPAKDTVFMLKAYEIDAIDVKEIRRSTIGSRITFLDLKPDPRGISIASLAIVDGHGETASFGALCRH
jgi:hypothetical protein